MAKPRTPLTPAQAARAEIWHSICIAVGDFGPMTVGDLTDFFAGSGYPTTQAQVEEVLLEMVAAGTMWWDRTTGLVGRY